MVCNELKLCRHTPQCKYTNCTSCREVNSGSSITCSEKKSRYSLCNPNHISVIVFHVDGGLVSSDEACLRCDYLYDINTPSKSAVIFIELKGMEFGKALKQIESTVKLFADAFGNSKRYARIICTRVPNIRNNPQDIRLRKSLEKLGVSLKTGTKDITEPIAPLLV